MLQLVTVANLSGASVGEVSLAASVENLIAKLDLVLLQTVDVLLQLGQLGVESLLLSREGDLMMRNIFIVSELGGRAGRRQEVSLRLIINSVKHNQVVLLTGQSQSD